MSDLNAALRVVRWCCSGQVDGAGIVLSLESKELEVLVAARALLLKNLPIDVTVISEEADSRRHSDRASMDVQQTYLLRK